MVAFLQGIRLWIGGNRLFPPLLLWMAEVSEGFTEEASAKVSPKLFPPRPLAVMSACCQVTVKAEASDEICPD